MFDKLIKNNLVWFPEKNMGYYPVNNKNYDKKYFDNYKLYEPTEMGKLITDSRVDLVKKYYGGEVIDVGIGCGDFIKKHGNAFGYDVSATAIEWLEKKDLYRCLYDSMYSVATFWDSLEHISKPDLAINQVEKLVFVSIPIFNSCNHILKSKHFKKDEHYWYFTEIGLIGWFSGYGFECVEKNTVEVDLGREDIGTYVFRRCNA